MNEQLSGKTTRRRFLFDAAVYGALVTGTTEVIFHSVPKSVAQSELYSLASHEGWHERDGINVIGEGELTSESGEMVTIRLNTEVVSDFMFAYAREYGLENELRDYLTTHKLCIALNVGTLPMDNQLAGQFVKIGADTSIIIITRRSISSFINARLDPRLKKDESILDATMTHEFFHLFQDVRGDLENMKEIAVQAFCISSGIAFGMGFAGVDMVGGAPKSIPRRAFLKGAAGLAGTTATTALSAKLMPRWSPQENEAYRNENVVMNAPFMQPFKGQFIDVTRA